MTPGWSGTQAGLQRGHPLGTLGMGEHTDFGEQEAGYSAGLTFSFP